METDVGSWTPFYEGLVHGTPRVLDCMAKHHVSGTFFFTSEAAQKYPDTLAAVAQAGHEVGCHSLYHETLGESLFPVPGVYPVLDHEVKPRIELSTRIVRDILGGPIASFRCPRLWGSTHVVNALEGLGYAADASYPMYFYRDRLLPYHPSAEDWTQQGDLKLVEIPNFADMSIESNDEFGRDRDQWPLFRTEGADALMEHIRGFVDFMSERHDEACLCFYFHPWEFWEMPQGAIHYGEGAVLPDPFITKNCGDVALEQFDKLIGRLLEMDAEFLSCKLVAERV